MVTIGSPEENTRSMSCMKKKRSIFYRTFSTPDKGFLTIFFISSMGW